MHCLRILKILVIEIIFFSCAIAFSNNSIVGTWKLNTQFVGPFATYQSQYFLLNGYCAQSIFILGAQSLQGDCLKYNLISDEEISFDFYSGDFISCRYDLSLDVLNINCPTGFMSFNRVDQSVTDNLKQGEIHFSEDYFNVFIQGIKRDNFVISNEQVSLYFPGDYQDLLPKESIWGIDFVEEGIVNTYMYTAITNEKKSDQLKYLIHLEMYFETQTDSLLLAKTVYAKTLEYNQPLKISGNYHDKEYVFSIELRSAQKE